MLQKFKDAQAAKKDFINIMEEEDDKTKAKLTATFITEFKLMYQHIRSEYKQNDQLPEETIKLFAISLHTLENLKKKSKLEEAEGLGDVFAYYMAAIDIYLAPNMNMFQSRKLKKILGLNNLIAKEIKSLNKKVSVHFITRRIAKIAMNHKIKLNKDQHEFFASLAAAFLF